MCSVAPMPEQLLRRDFPGADIDPLAITSDLPERAQVVVVGAGIVGASIAYHLATLGRDVLVLERHGIASGTSWHAAGLVVKGRSGHVLTELASYGVDLYRRLGVETGVDVNLAQPGSLTLARTQGRMDELRYFSMVCRHHGVPAELISPARVAELWPLASADGLVGALHQPLDGHINPGLAAYAFAKGATAHGAAYRQAVSVSGVETRAGRVSAVLTDRGRVECEHAVLACGLWTRDLAATVGAHVPLWPAAHVHVQSGPIAGAVPSLPVLRDLDASFYARHLDGRLLIGAFEPDGQPLDPASLPDEFAYGRFEPDWDHFAPVRALAEERIPALRTTEWGEFLNAPESFTPDANFCIGETNEVVALFVAAGFNSQGIIFAAGAGKVVAEWIVAGTPQIDVAGLDVRRFAMQQSNRHYLHGRVKEGLGRLYALHWPFLQPHTARGIRRTPLHMRTEALNACYGELNGWERPNWYAPPGVTPEYGYSFGRQNWFEYAAAEHHAVRSGVGVIDLSTFAKFEVAGPDALAVLQWICTKDLDVAVGRAVYTLMLDESGNIDLDGTVTRLGPERFMLVTPTNTHAQAEHLLRPLAVGRAAAVFDATSALATIAVAGPRSRELLQRISRTDLSNEALAWSHGMLIEVADGYAYCLRVSFTGELGYELYPSADLALNVFDSVLEAGADLGLKPFGYHALDSLRAEKGYRHVGHDIGNLDDPYEAALGYTVSMHKSDGFRGRAALIAKYGDSKPRPARRQVFVRLNDPEPLLYGYESLIHKGRIVSRLTSAAYGHTVGGAVALAYLAADIDAAGRFEVDCAGTVIAAAVSDKPFYDRGNQRLTA